MKKSIMAIILTACMAVASVCAAVGEGAALGKEQKVAENFYAGLNGSTEITYEQASVNLVSELKTKVTEATYSDLQKSVKEKLGACKEAKFRSFERFNDGDRVVYIGNYSKEEVVAMIFVFDTKGKLASFALNPLQKQEDKSENSQE